MLWTVWQLVDRVLSRWIQSPTDYPESALLVISPVGVGASRTASRGHHPQSHRHVSVMSHRSRAIYCTRLFGHDTCLNSNPHRRVLPSDACSPVQLMHIDLQSNHVVLLGLLHVSTGHSLHRLYRGTGSCLPRINTKTRCNSL